LHGVASGLQQADADVHDAHRFFSRGRSLRSYIAYSFRRKSMRPIMARYDAMQVTT